MSREQSASIERWSNRDLRKLVEVTDDMVEIATRVYADTEDLRGGRGDRHAMRLALNAALKRDDD